MVKRGTHGAPQAKFAPADGPKGARLAQKANGRYISEISVFYLLWVGGFWAGGPYKYARICYTMAHASGDPDAHESGTGPIMVARQILRIATDDTIVQAAAPLRRSRHPPRRNFVIRRRCVSHFGRGM